MQGESQDVGKVHSNLILPKHVEEEAKRSLVSSFKSALENVINKEQWRKMPYFVSYHETDDKVDGGVNVGWKADFKLPAFMARQIVYWVDNKKGFKEWIWTINDDCKPFFNVEGVRKAKKSGAIVPPKKR